MSFKEKSQDPQMGEYRNCFTFGDTRVRDPVVIEKELSFIQPATALGRDTVPAFHLAKY